MASAGQRSVYARAQLCCAQSFNNTHHPRHHTFCFVLLESAKLSKMSSISPPTVAGPLLLPTLAVPDAAAAPGNTNGLWRLPMTMASALFRTRRPAPASTRRKKQIERVTCPASGPPRVGALHPQPRRPGGLLQLGSLRGWQVRGAASRVWPLENRETFSVIVEGGVLSKLKSLRNNLTVHFAGEGQRLGQETDRQRRDPESSAPNSVLLWDIAELMASTKVTAQPARRGLRRGGCDPIQY